MPSKKIKKQDLEKLILEMNKKCLKSMKKKLKSNRQKSMTWW